MYGDLVSIILIIIIIIGLGLGGLLYWKTKDIYTFLIGIMISLMIFFIVYGADIPIIVRIFMFLFIIYILYIKLFTNNKIVL